MEEKEQKVDVYTIAEKCELPSRGLIYDKPLDPHIELRSMNTMEEMQRLSPSKTPYKTLATIIESCTLTKPTPSVYDLCLGDYEYLLHELRIISYGPDYKMNVMCPVCGHVDEAAVDLDKLKVLEYDSAEIKNLRTLRLPKTNKLVCLKFQTPRMLDEIELRKEEFKKHSADGGPVLNFDPTLMITLQLSIETVDGVALDYMELENFVKRLPVKDTNAIVNRLEKINRKVGLDNHVDHVCSKCGYDISTFFRFGPEFFRPTEDE